MSDQNCIYCGELVNYSSEPEFGETGDKTPNGPAHHRCIAKARIEELEAKVKHFRTKATRLETENNRLKLAVEKLIRRASVDNCPEFETCRPFLDNQEDCDKCWRDWAMKTEENGG